MARNYILHLVIGYYLVFLAELIISKIFFLLIQAIVIEGLCYLPDVLFRQQVDCFLHNKSAGCLLVQF
jgi:hypothetical protein